MLIFAFLQLLPGTFSIFYHYALAKTSAKKADDQSLSFILGAEILVATIWFIVYITIFCIFYDAPDFCPLSVYWTLAGIMLAEAIIIPFFYFRRSKITNTSTALFIPRNIASTLSMRARKAKSRPDCITLGLIAGLPELIFTLPLYVISTIILLDTAALPRAAIIILYIIVATLPLFIIRLAYRTGHNLAEITRIRTKLKPHFRFILCIAYLCLAIAIINLGALQNG